MAVSITRVQIKNLYPRLFEKIYDTELDAYLARATLQVAQWVIESASTPGVLAWNQFYEDEAAHLYVAVAGARDKLATAADTERENSDTTQATARLNRERHYTSSYATAYKLLKADLDKLLEKLGVSLAVQLAAPSSVIKGADDTDPGITWTYRNDDPSAISNR